MVIARTSTSLKQFIAMSGNLRDEDILRENIKKYTTSADVEDVIASYYELLVHTDYLKEECYLFYIVGLSYKEINEATGYTINSLRTLMYNEVTKIFKDLGSYDPYALLVTDGYNDVNKGILSIVLSKLKDTTQPKNYDEMREKYQKTETEIDDMEIDTSILGGNLTSNPLYIDIDRLYNQDVSDEDLANAVGKLMYLTPNYQQVILSSIDAKLLGYLEYLYTTPEESLTEEDIDRKQWVIEELKI